MATTISTQDIVDAKRDIDDIGKAVNEKVIVSPRYGEDFKSLPLIAADAQTKISEWESAISLITQEGGVPALAVSDASGLNQQEVNNGVESIADLIAIPNPKNGNRVYVKSYHAGLGKGGGDFVYNSSRASENDGGSVVNGWVRVNTRNYVDVTEFGVVGDKVTSDVVAMQKALDYAYANRMNLELCHDINLTGGTLYVPSINFGEFIKIYGGGIYKADSGFVFSCLASNNARDAPVIENINFLGSGVAGVVPVVFDGDKMIRHQAYNCRFRHFCFVHSTSYLQSIRFSENNVVYYSPDSFIKAANAYDFKVLNNSFEASNHPAMEFLGQDIVGGSYALSGATINDNLFEGFTKTGCIVFPDCSSVSIDNNYFEGNKHEIHIRTLPEDKNPNYLCHNLSISGNYISATQSTNSIFVENNKLSTNTARIEGNFVSRFKTDSPDNVFVNAPFRQSLTNKNFLGFSIKMSSAGSFANMDNRPAPAFGFSTEALSGGGVRAIVKNLFSRTGTSETTKSLPTTGYLVTINGQGSSGSTLYKFSHTGVLGFGILYNSTAAAVSLVLEHSSLLNIGTSGTTTGVGSVASDVVIKFAETNAKYKPENTNFTEQQLFIDMPKVTTITSVDIVPLSSLIKTTTSSILPYSPTV